MHTRETRFETSPTLYRSQGVYQVILSDCHENIYSKARGTLEVELCIRTHFHMMRLEDRGIIQNRWKGIHVLLQDPLCT